ncbi:MAG: MFS transporter [Stellaceae bacterium]
MTGFYTMATSLGAAIAGGATVPLTFSFAGSWPAALGIWAVPVAIAAAIWLPQLRAKTALTARTSAPVRRLWTDPLAWQVTFFMGLQGSFAYIVFGWFVPILRDRGVGADEAGFILSIGIVAQAIGALVTPMIAARIRDQRASISLAVIFVVVGLFGCMYAPLSGVYLWSTVLGFSRGATFSLAITVIVLRSPNAHVATYLSGMSQTVGYLIACLGPLAAGLLRAWTGDWNLAAVFFGLIGLFAIFFGIGAGRRLHVRAA